MNHDEVLLDSRSRKDLANRLESLAASYTPEWRFDSKDPDIGSALALIYIDQMEDNIRRLNQLPEKYHTEFANLLGLTLHSAYPASGVAVVELLRGTVPGVELPRGTSLTAEADGGSVFFETKEDVYITNAQLTDILSLSGTHGKIYPLLGGAKPAELIANPQKTFREESSPEAAEQTPFLLFDYSEAGIEKNAVLFYHSSVFGVDASTPIEIQLIGTDGEAMAPKFADPSQWRWSYLGNEGLTPFTRVCAKGNALHLYRDHELNPQIFDGQAYYSICLEALQPIEDTVTVSDIRISSCRDEGKPELILRDGQELSAVECMPFGETISLFDECYICDNQVFSQMGATVHLSFQLSSRRKMMNLTAVQQKEELKIIKLKPKAVQYTAATTAPEQVTIEYYNGQLWRTLPCDQDWSQLLDGTHNGKHTIAFTCPADWHRVPINGYEGLCLRIRVTQADNCYLLPCEHTAPVLENVQLTYSYENMWKQPQRVETISGTQRENQTDAFLQGKLVTLFKALPYPEASLYLGFDRPFEGAPISMLFDVEENVHFHMEPITFEYSTRNGFRQMKVIDRTRQFAGSGTVLFMPPSDFEAMEVENIRRWWIRLRSTEEAVKGYHPPIRSIRLNAVDISNCHTQPEESFYIETSTANMTFQLSAQNILCANVFVSEFGELSRSQMRKMQEEQPEDVRVETDFLGEITGFYVRWTEVDTFDRSQIGDRHYMIDRASNTLIFGDGIHVKIPQARQDAAILVQTVSCDGSRGNVPAGAISGFYSNVLYVSSVTNPSKTFAGSDLEDLESARKRGAELFSGRGRLISETDYLRAVKSFSGTIEKVKCMAGYDRDGVFHPSVITIAIMTQDYASGNESFHNIREPLRKMLLEKCEATVRPEDLLLTEPSYVTISVSVWVKTADSSHAFSIQNLILDSISRFLDPLPSPGHSGWDIGVLPTENQLTMLLQSLRFPGHISRIVTVARYADPSGTHEVALDEMPNAPFAIGIGGDCHVYIEFQ